MPSPSLSKSLRQALTPNQPSPASQQPRHVVVVGVGSRLRADDAAGLAVAEELGRRRVPDVSVVLGDTAPENVTGEIRRFQPTHVLFVDAADFGERPGSSRMFESASIGGMTSSTHTLPLHVIADYLRSELGCRILFVGLQPKSLAFGGPISPEVTHAVDEVVASIVEALS